MRSASEAGHALAPLLEALRAEPCVHSWKAHLPTSGPCDAEVVRRLLTVERARRPTVAFAYVAEDQRGLEEVVAVGCVSARLRCDFGEAGFPVLARCYIRPPWRRRGLYRALLEHRVAWCEERWGDRLRAIHLGTADPAVWKVATASEGGAPRFVHIGDEDLVVGAQVHAVRDLLAFDAGYAARLAAEATTLGLRPGGAEAAQRLGRLITVGLPHGGVVALEAALAELPASATEDLPELSALLRLARAIPVVR